MSDKLDISVLDNLERLKEESQLIVTSLVGQLTSFLKLEPYSVSVQVDIVPTISESKVFHNFRASREYSAHSIKIRLSKTHEKFFPFLLLRELYNLFVPLK